MLEEIQQIAATERFVFVRTSEIFRGGLKYSVLHVHVPTSRIARFQSRLRGSTSPWHGGCSLIGGPALAILVEGT
jgi:hypothetical protein